MLQEIGKTAPAPQGIAVLNSKGQALAWSLMFKNDQEVLNFLDYAKSKYKQTVDGTEFKTEKFVRYPEEKQPAVPANNGLTPVPSHSSADCIGSNKTPAGSLSAKVYGRVVAEDGTNLNQEVNQEHYAQDRFDLPSSLLSGLLSAFAEGKACDIPRTVAELFAGYAYLGPLDVKPINNPAFGSTEVLRINFRAEPDSQNSNLWHVTGESHIKCASPPGGRTFSNEIELSWTGYIRLEEKQVRRIALVASGKETLKWNPGLGNADVPVVSHLPAGRRINFSGHVRYGIETKQ